LRFVRRRSRSNLKLSLVRARVTRDEVIEALEQILRGLRKAR
jgi:hypothetical protein